MLDAEAEARFGRAAASALGLAGKSALVVGGGAGIGEATARLFASVGAHVGVVDRDLALAERVADAIGAAGGRATAIACDILDDDATVRMVGEADAALGGIDILVTIIGSSRWGSLLDMSWEDWSLDHCINLRAIFGVARAVAAAMIARGRGGAMAFVGSVSGVQSAPNHGAYGAAKAGLVNLVRTMAVEWAEHGIRVNCAAPGSVATPRLPDTPDRVADFAAGKVPIKHRARPDEIAGGLLFLVSDLAGYVTGQTLMVDGGWTAANLRFGPGSRI